MYVYIYMYICTRTHTQWNYSAIKKNEGTSLVAQWVGLRTPNAGGPGSTPGQGTRSHVPQLRVHMPQLRSPPAATNTQCDQINN